VILGGVSIVGPAPALSPDGVWMAFTARPEDAAGSDVYAWRPGLAAPRRLTADGRSVFGGWAGRLLLVSAIVAGDDREGEPTAAGTDTRTILVDPATGGSVGEAIADAWQPSLDPLARFVVFWEGTVDRASDGRSWQPDHGRLVLATFGLAPAPSSVDRHRHGGGRPTTVTPIVSHRTTLAEGGVSAWSIAWDAAGSTARVWITDHQGLSRLVTVVPADLAAAFRSLPVQTRLRR
jgi:hypothetical protein